LPKKGIISTFQSSFHIFPGAQIFIYMRSLVSSTNTSTMAW